MINLGLLVRFEAKHGRDADVEALLESAVPLVVQEPGTIAWFGIRFGRSEYGIFDVFPDESARQAHLAGPVAHALMAQTDTLLEGAPSIERLDVIAHKLPPGVQGEPVNKGLLLSLAAKPGHELQVESFLHDAKSLVEQEPKTIAWFAIRRSDGRYGIFDVFHDNAGRFAHLAGDVPRELTKHALSLLGSVPDLDMLDVKGAKMAAPVSV
jgi:quinol monooxygenase YgiN